MPTFALEWIDVPNCIEAFFKIFINGDCPLDQFWEAMERAGNQRKDLDKLQTLITLISQGQRLPADKFKELQGRNKKDVYKDFEIKAGRLRLYLFEDLEAGKIIVLGELKKDSKRQHQKIEEMRAIKLEYFASKSS